MSRRVEESNVPPGWDQRDYELWGRLHALPSYGLISRDNPMIALKDVLELLKEAATKRGAANAKPTP